MHLLQSLPNLRHLRAFSLTARHNSIKRAAAEVFLSQPAVTQAVSKLESEFGETFFTRTPTGMYCTEYGNVLLHRVDRALATLASIAIMPKGKARADAARDPLTHLTSAHLRTMIAVADLGCFETAAETLQISKTSLLRTVRALEFIFGTRLFLRSANGIVLSAGGDIFARHAKLAVREIESAREEIEHMRGNRIGRIVIGSMPLARVDIVPKAVARLLNRLPDLQIRILEGTYSGLMAGLRSGEIDVVVGALRTPAPYPDVEERELFSDALSIVVRKGHALTRQRTVSLSDTIGYPWIVSSKGTPTRDLFHAVFRSRALMEPKRILEVSSNVCMRASLLASDRIAMVSRRQIMIEEESGLLEVLPLELPDTARPIGLTLRSGWAPSLAQKILVDELVEAAAEAPLIRTAGKHVKRTRKVAFPGPE
ncbi:LysR family transcriptional regulator [Chelativorans salis]|uniref:LysR family transcriptional regulator n=1 Tax=Chelativorans salis TaxID=2978478 RepID=A0ABT2LUD4_9HYPH|nr:LysR family transcriptional regulator [Chelativorans sp. EGI FJ00035]MCT7378140.1 LysR family transcriptional regulator [Chelativorans sp. EGI FJ00035]